MAPPIVDMRIRPTWLHKFFGSTPGTPEYDVVRWLNKRVGSKDVDHFTHAPTLKDLTAEMDSADLAVGIMVARSTPSVHVDNDAVAAVAQDSRGRLLGVASVDPVAVGVQNALKEVERSVVKLGLIGLNIDAGFYKKAMRADDPTLMPLYEACQGLKIPVFLLSGPTTPDLNLNDPFVIDTIAAQFRDLKIVVCHGCYPHVDAMVGVAFRRENVFVSPDMYMFSPGGKLYIEAANGFMQDQYLFGTSYPFRPMRQSVDDLRSIGLRPDVLEKVSYKNACRLLDLDEKAIGAFAPRIPQERILTAV
ncbi:MAG: amidohydrolase family protein [Methylovirgula sp.]